MVQKTNPKELQYVQYDSENWQQWVRYKKKQFDGTDVQKSVYDPSPEP